MGLGVENNGMAVRDEKSYYSEKHGRDVYEMSDRLNYALDDKGRWFIILN